MNATQLAIKALAQQWELDARVTDNPKTKHDLYRQLFALQVLCIRLGFDSLEVDLELAMASVSGSPLDAA